MNNIELYWGDCLKIMDGLIADGVKVNAVITSPPYGTTACKRTGRNFISIELDLNYYMIAQERINKNPS